MNMYKLWLTHKETQEEDCLKYNAEDLVKAVELFCNRYDYENEYEIKKIKEIKN